MCWTCYRCRNITFVHPLVVHGNRSFQELYHHLNLSITQRQFNLETHCLFLHLRICLHCQKITYINSSFTQEKKEMMTKLRPSYADSVTATSWSPRPKARVGTTTAHRAGFCECVRPGNKPCAVGGSGSHPRFWPRGPACGGH